MRTRRLKDAEATVVAFDNEGDTTVWKIDREVAVTTTIGARTTARYLMTRKVLGVVCVYRCDMYGHVEYHHAEVRLSPRARSHRSALRRVLALGTTREMVLS